MTSSHCSSDMKASSTSRLMPALLTRQSIGPEALINLMEKRGGARLAAQIGGHGQCFSPSGTDALHHVIGRLLPAIIVNRNAKSFSPPEPAPSPLPAFPMRLSPTPFFCSRHSRAYLKGLKIMIIMPQREL